MYRSFESDSSQTAVTGNFLVWIWINFNEVRGRNKTQLKKLKLEKKNNQTSNNVFLLNHKLSTWVHKSFCEIYVPLQVNWVDDKRNNQRRWAFGRNERHVFYRLWCSLFIACIALRLIAPYLSSRCCNLSSWHGSICFDFLFHLNGAASTTLQRYKNKQPTNCRLSMRNLKLLFSRRNTTLHES